MPKGRCKLPSVAFRRVVSPLLRLLRQDPCNEALAQRCQIDFLQAAADDWPMFMRDNRHQGYARTSDGTSITGFGEPVWTQPIDTATTSRSDWTSTSGHPNPGANHTDTWVFEHPYIDSSPVHATNSPIIVGAWVGSTGSYLSSSKRGIWPHSILLQVRCNGTIRQVHESNDSLRLPGGIASTPAVATVSSQQRVYLRLYGRQGLLPERKHGGAHLELPDQRT